MKSLFAVLILAAAGLHSDPAFAQKYYRSYERTGFKLNTCRPKNPDHEPLFRLMKERRILEKFKEFLSPLRLPRALRLKFEGCDGDRTPGTA